MICQHQWRPTGARGVHVEFPTKTAGRRALYAIYVRCSACGQHGFTRPGRLVIYTWDKNPENWLAAS